MSPEFPALLAHERVLDEPDELLLRQIIPGWVKNGTITSQVFKPSDAQASVYRPAVVTAEEAHEHWTEVLSRPTCGTCAVSVGEVGDAGARVVDDSDDPEVHRGHAYIDARGLGRQDRERAALQLKRAAIERGLNLLPT